MKIKVCGIGTVDQFRRLNELSIDYVGMIFYKGSKRYVGEKFESLKQEIKNTAITKVGVFVNEEPDKIERAIADYGLEYIQLHGDEDVEYCNELKDKVKLIKAFRLTGETDVDELTKPFRDIVDYFLFDTAPLGLGLKGAKGTEIYGGTGEKFNWAVLTNAVIGKPFFLSGGISLEEAGEIRSFSHPFLHAVDINSRFETEPGIKDMSKVELFKQSINHE